MAQIQLTRGKFAIVDDADFVWLSQWKWRVQPNKENFYAARKGRSGEPKTVMMHRFILGLTGPWQTDHIDRNGLNNQRSNLRVATRSQNGANRKLRTNTSGFKGVCWNKASQKWQAAIQVLGKVKYLGVYENINDAHAAYVSAANESYGEFACT